MHAITCVIYAWWFSFESMHVEQVDGAKATLNLLHIETLLQIWQQTRILYTIKSFKVQQLHFWYIFWLFEWILVVIDHLHTSKNILVTFLIVVASQLDALVACKNVLQLMRIQWSPMIKRPSQVENTVKPKFCKQ